MNRFLFWRKRVIFAMFFACVAGGNSRRVLILICFGWKSPEKIRNKSIAGITGFSFSLLGKRERARREAPDTRNGGSQEGSRENKTSRGKIRRAWSDELRGRSRFSHRYHVPLQYYLGAWKRATVSPRSLDKRVPRATSPWLREQKSRQLTPYAYLGQWK